MATRKKQPAELENDNITISASTLLDDFLFCVARYCIGRHSYVSMYASEIWNIIDKNLDKFDHDRLLFFAGDLRAEISDRVGRYFSQFKVENAYNHDIVKDANTLLADYLDEHPDVDIKKTKFYIDCVNCTVETEPYTPKPDDYSLGDLFTLPDHDLSAWALLADRIESAVKNYSKRGGQQ